MKSAFAGIALALSISVAASQESESNKETPQIKKVEMPILCMKSKTAEQVIISQKEEFFFVALDKIHQVENLSLNVFRNSETGSFTVVFVTPDKDLVCVLSAGDNSKFIFNN